jgi:hypothetical protein
MLIVKLMLYAKRMAIVENRNNTENIILAMQPSMFDWRTRLATQNEVTPNAPRKPSIYTVSAPIAYDVDNPQALSSTDWGCPATLDYGPLGDEVGETLRFVTSIDNIPADDRAQVIYVPRWVVTSAAGPPGAGLAMMILAMCRYPLTQDVNYMLVEVDDEEGAQFVDLPYWNYLNLVHIPGFSGTIYFVLPNQDFANRQSTAAQNSLVQSRPITGPAEASTSSGDLYAPNTQLNMYYSGIENVEDRTTYEIPAAVFAQSWMAVDQRDGADVTTGISRSMLKTFISQLVGWWGASNADVLAADTLTNYWMARQIPNNRMPKAADGVPDIEDWFRADIDSSRNFNTCGYLGVQPIRLLRKDGVDPGDGTVFPASAGPRYHLSLCDWSRTAWSMRAGGLINSVVSTVDAAKRIPEYILMEGCIGYGYITDAINLLITSQSVISAVGVGPKLWEDQFRGTSFTWLRKMIWSFFRVTNVRNTIGYAEAGTAVKALHSRINGVTMPCNQYGRCLFDICSPPAVGTTDSSQSYGFEPYAFGFAGSFVDTPLGPDGDPALLRDLVLWTMPPILLQQRVAGFTAATVPYLTPLNGLSAWNSANTSTDRLQDGRLFIPFEGNKNTYVNQDTGLLNGNSAVIFNQRLAMAIFDTTTPCDAEGNAFDGLLSSDQVYAPRYKRQDYSSGLGEANFSMVAANDMLLNCDSANPMFTNEGKRVYMTVQFGESISAGQIYAGKDRNLAVEKAWYQNNGNVLPINLLEGPVGGPIVWPTRQMSAGMSYGGAIADSSLSETVRVPGDGSGGDGSMGLGSGGLMSGEAPGGGVGPLDPGTCGPRKA